MARGMGRSRGRGSTIGSVMQGVTPISSAVLEFRQGGSVIATSTTSLDGTYTAPSLSAGTYDIMCHPPLSYQMSLSEPETRSYVHPNGLLPSFAVESAHYAQDFQGFADTTALRTASNWDLNPLMSSTIDWQSGGTGPVTLDVTGGPGGTKAMMFEWPTGGVQAQQHIGPLFRWNHAGAGLDADDIWILWTHRFSDPFWVNVAYPGDGTSNYKWIIPHYGSKPDGTNSQEDEFFTNNTSQYDLNTRLQCPGEFVENTTDIAITRADMQTWLTWATRFTRVGAGVTKRLYRNGVLVDTLTIPTWAVGEDRNLKLLQYGGNMNSGPGQAGQRRWTREIGIYTSRPGLRPRF